MSLLTRAKDLAYNPEHTRWMTPLLLIADAALCGVVIEKIPCSYRLHPRVPQDSKFPLPSLLAYAQQLHVGEEKKNLPFSNKTCRYRNRLDNVYAANRHFPKRRARLRKHIWRHGAAGVSWRARLDLQASLCVDGRGQEYRACAVHFRLGLSAYAGGGISML